MNPNEPKIEPASGSGSNPTTMGSTVGTPAFMPPEQAEGRLDELGATSDDRHTRTSLLALRHSGKVVVISERRSR